MYTVDSLVGLGSTLQQNVASMNGHRLLITIDRSSRGGMRWTSGETEVEEGNYREWQCFEFF